MLPVKNTRFGRFCRSLRKLGQLTKHHPETFEYFRSDSAVIAERQRQLLEEGGRVIHPLSLFSIFWTTFMIVVNLCVICISTFRSMYVLEPLESLQIHVLDRILLCFYAWCFVDIVMKFNTGYIDTKHSTIIMDRKWIACRYLRCWFAIDLVSCLPIAFILLAIKARPQAILLAHLLPVLRTSRIYTVIKDLKTFIRTQVRSFNSLEHTELHCLVVFKDKAIVDAGLQVLQCYNGTCPKKMFTESYIIHGLVRICLIFVVSAHLCICLIYLPAVISYYWTDKMPTHYKYMRFRAWDTYDKMIRYNKVSIIVLSAFFGTGFSMFRSPKPEEIVIHSLIIVYAAMFMVFFLVFLIKSYLTIFASSTRYNGLMNQVEEYMKYRQFPLALKKRVRAFYQYRYQERYFKEENDLDCLSEELRDEIKLHTCRSLVHKVKLFEDVPASVVGTILGCLKPEVYLSNDLVVRAGDIGDCMYFIATGTVAVYSLKGVEVCHLEDGSHFGEVALLMKDSKRVATVVAVEITQLYRLDIIDFNCFVMSHPLLYERIQELAARRMHATVLLDDEFRREREKLVEHLSDINNVALD